jgi:hypothetical protein
MRRTIGGSLINWAVGRAVSFSVRITMFRVKWMRTIKHIPAVWGLRSLSYWSSIRRILLKLIILSNILYFHWTNWYMIQEMFHQFSIYTEETELCDVNKTSVNLHKYFQWKMYKNGSHSQVLLRHFWNLEKHINNNFICLYLNSYTATLLLLVT